MASVLDSAEPFIAHTPSRVSGPLDQNKLDGYEVGQIRSWLMALRDGTSHSFNVKRYGASASSDDNTAAFADAEEDITSRGGGVLVFPEGTWRGLLRPTSKMVVRGAGRATILKAPAGSNAAVIEGKNFATLTGKSYAPTDITAGDNYVGLHDLTIDGDKATQSSGWGIRLWGRSYSWSNVIVQNCKEGGIWTEFTTHPDGGIESLLESFFDNVKTHGSDGDGWRFRGPHDSVISKLVTVYNTGWGFRSEVALGSYNGGIFNGVNWNSWLNTLGSFSFGGAVSLEHSTASGVGGTGIVLPAGAGAQKLTGILVSGHETGAILRGSNVSFSGQFLNNSGDALVLDGLGNAIIDVSGVGNANFIDVISEDAPNFIRATVAVPAGGSLVTGAFSGSDVLQIVPVGAVSTPVFQVPAAGGAVSAFPTAGFAIVAQAPDAGTVNTELRDHNGNPAFRVSGSGVTQILDHAFVVTRVTPTYGASVQISPAAGNEFVITPADGAAFTVETPVANVGVAGQRITIRVVNSTGGALGTVTWGTGYKMAAWTSPATGFSRAIDFQFDGTNWIEVSRTPDDVPN